MEDVTRLVYNLIIKLSCFMFNAPAFFAKHFLSRRGSSKGPPPKVCTSTPKPIATLLALSHPQATSVNDFRHTPYTFATPCCAGFDRIVVVVVIIISTGSNVGLTTSLAEMRLIYEVQNRLNQGLSCFIYDYQPYTLVCHSLGLLWLCCQILDTLCNWIRHII